MTFCGGAEYEQLSWFALRGEKRDHRARPTQSAREHHYFPTQSGYAQQRVASAGGGRRAAMTTRMQSCAKAPITPIPSFTPVRSRVLQRKCACGGTTGPSGECEECRKKSLQRKASQLSTHDSHTSEVPPIVHEGLRSPGQPLNAATRTFTQQRFGHNFTALPI